MTNARKLLNDGDHKKICVDAATVTVLSEPGDISSLNEEQRTTANAFLCGKDLSVHPAPAWLWQEIDIDWPLLNVTEHLSNHLPTGSTRSHLVFPVSPD